MAWNTRKNGSEAISLAQARANPTRAGPQAADANMALT